MTRDENFDERAVEDFLGVEDFVEQVGGFCRARMEDFDELRVEDYVEHG